jgi:branched-chain amino acid transport system substrate-binding protein
MIRRKAASPDAGRRARLSSSALLAAAVAILLAACGSSTSSTAQSSSSSNSAPFTIGVILPLTGPFAVIGEAAQDGMQVAVDDVNKNSHGILGRQVKLLIRDDAGDTAKAIAAAKELVDQDHVDFLFPGAFASDALAILPYTTQRKVVTVTTTGSSDAGKIDKFPYSFQLSIPFETYPKPIAASIQKIAGSSATKVGLFVSGEASGVAQGDVLNGALPKNGFTVVGYEKFDPTAKDVTPQLGKLKNAGADVVVLAAPGATLRTVMTGVRDLAWKVPVVATNGTATGDIKALVPPEVAGQFHAVVFRQYARSDPDKVQPQYQSYVNQLKSQFGALKNLGVSALHSDIVKLVKWAYEKAGGTDQNKVRSALESMSKTTLPDNYFLVVSNPRWSSTVHSTLNGDFSNFFWLVDVSPLVDGTFMGTPITGS